jgi:hypothetical protein
MAHIDNRLVMSLTTWDQSLRNTAKQRRSALIGTYSWRQLNDDNDDANRIFPVTRFLCYIIDGTNHFESTRYQPVRSLGL